MITLRTPKTVAAAMTWAGQRGISATQLINDDTNASGDTVTLGYMVPPGSRTDDQTTLYLQATSAFLQGLRDDLADPQAMTPDPGHLQHVDSLRIRTGTGSTSITRIVATGPTQTLQSLTGDPSVADVGVMSAIQSQPDYPAEPPEITLTTNPNPVPYNGDVVVGWDNPDQISAVCNDNLGHHGGAQDAWWLRNNVTSGFVYSVHCQNSVGSDDETRTVDVGPPPPPGPPPPEEWEVLESPLNCSLPWYPRVGTIKSGQMSNGQRFVIQQMAWTPPRIARLSHCKGTHCRTGCGAWPDNRPTYEPDAVLLAYPGTEDYYYGWNVRYWADNFPGSTGYLDTQEFDNLGVATSWTVGNSNAKRLLGNHTYWTRINTDQGGISVSIGGPEGQWGTNYCGHDWGTWCVFPGGTEPFMSGYTYPTNHYTMWWDPPN